MDPMAMPNSTESENSGTRPDNGIQQLRRWKARLNEFHAALDGISAPTALEYIESATDAFQQAVTEAPRKSALRRIRSCSTCYMLSSSSESSVQMTRRSPRALSTMPSLPLSPGR
jgi:hypothetical protein